MKAKFVQLIFLGANAMLLAQNDTLYHPIERVILNANFSTKNKKIHTQSVDWLNHDAGKFLTSIPEFSGVRKSGNYSTDPVFRGFKYEQLNIITDGAQNAIQACPSRMDAPASQINMNQIEKVEIYKGPYFFRFGASVGASVNFVSFKPEFSDSLKADGRLSTSYESNGNISRNEAMLNLRSKKIIVQFTDAYQKGDDYKDGAGNTVPAQFERYNFGNKITYSWNRDHYTTFQTITNQGRNTDFPALSMKLLYDKTWMFQLMHHSEFHHSLVKELNVNAYSSTVHHSMGTENRSMVSDVSSGTYGMRSELKLVTGKHQLYTGLDYKNESANNTSLTMGMAMPMKRDGTSWQDSGISQVGWFNEYQYSSGKSSLKLSYRMDYNSASASEEASLFQKLYGKMDTRQLNHNISAGYEQGLDHDSQISLWIGGAQRSASLTERFINQYPVGNDNYEYVGNPLLKPETNNQADLIYTWKPHPKFYVQLNLFYSLMENYISAIVRTDLKPLSMSSPGTRQFQNIGKAYRTGFETQIKWHINAVFHSEVAAAYTYAEDLTNKNPLPEIAPLDIRWKLAAEKGSFFGSVNYRFAGKQKRINPNFSELETPDFSLLDLHLGYKIFRGGRFSLDINNLLNRNYTEYLNRTLYKNTQRIMMPGRNVGLSYSYDF